MKIFISFYFFLVLFSCDNRKTTTSDVPLSARVGNKQEEVTHLEMSKLSLPDYLDWVASNARHLSFTAQSEKYSFLLSYEPTPYVAYRNNNNQTLTPTHWAEFVHELKGWEFFKLRIQGREPHLKNTDISEKLTPEFFMGVKLLTGSQEVSCSMHHVESSMSIAPFTTVLLGFKGVERPFDTIAVVLPVSGFSRQSLKIEISEETLDQIPEPDFRDY